MGYVDIFIPLIIGIFVITMTDKLIKNDDIQAEKKKRLLKICGYLSIIVAALFYVVKVYN
jgi:hypothetical protein